MWEHFAQVMSFLSGQESAVSSGPTSGSTNPSFRVPKVTKEDNPEAFLKAFEWAAIATGGLE